jgi:hypothetical protein
VLYCLSVLQIERATANFEEWENGTGSTRTSQSEKRGGHRILTIFSQPAVMHIILVNRATCWRSSFAINGARTTSEQRLTILLA